MKTSLLTLCSILALASLPLGCSSIQPKAHATPAGTTAQHPFSIQEPGDPEGFSEPGAGFNLVKPDGTGSVNFFGYGDPSQGSRLRVNNTTYRVKRISLKVLSKGGGAEDVGTRTIEVWGNGKITLELDYTITSAGEGNIGFAGKATIKLGGQQATYQIRGSAGC